MRVFYVKIGKMNSIKSPNHLSYKKHRKQFWLHIFLPMLLSIVLIVAVSALTTLSAFGESGDASRWAAVSTVWLVIPVMLFGVLVLAIIIAIIYLMARALKDIPSYTATAQHYVYRGTDIAKRYSEMATKPVLFLQGINASLKTFFGKK